MPKLPVNQLTRGSAINMDGNIYTIVKMQHVKPGKGPAYQQILLKDIESGKVIDKRFRAADVVESVDVDRQQCTYSYKSGETMVFMNSKTYEETEVHQDLIGSGADYLLEGFEVTILYATGRVVDVELPASVELKITECDPGVKNATATNVFKNAVVETGLNVQVPPFINIGDTVKIDTDGGKYIERTSIG
ncbi:MAG: elongation factor P [Planctomycetes bacterium]|nr:elongation factor P [Planctomycetota bacterium]